MRLPVALGLAVLVAAIAPAQETIPTPSEGLYGQIRGTTYHAPQGRFRVTVPVLPELGGKVYDTENVVTFTDDVSTHVSIACFTLDMSQRWERDTRTVREYLSYFYAEFLLPDFASRFPEVATEQALFAPELLGGAVFVFTLLPGGSAFGARATVVEAPGTLPLPAAKRGNLLFLQQDTLFVISMELAERVTQRSTFNKTADEENAILRDRLLELVQKMQITVPRAAPRRP
jgi:hypothetical protein